MGKQHICVGLLAHVDAGKTTLSEAMLYVSGTRRTLGRVDHADAYLDTHALERARGITIFSKQARLELEDRMLTLVDTPGHVDFATETERTLPILDCAILVISATAGIQAHTVTLWNLLERYHVPTILFVNKLDLPGKPRKELLERSNSPELDKLMEQRRNYCYQAGDPRMMPCDGAEKYHLGAAAPILCQGDLMGCVMLLLQEDDQALQESDLQLAQTAASFLGKQMES